MLYLVALPFQNIPHLPGLRCVVFLINGRDSGSGHRVRLHIRSIPCALLREHEELLLLAGLLGF